MLRGGGEGRFGQGLGQRRPAHERISAVGRVVAVQRHETGELVDAQFALQEIHLRLRAAAPELAVEVESGARVPRAVFRPVGLQTG